MTNLKRLCLVFAAVTLIGATTQETVTQVRAWRVDHEKQILLELFDSPLDAQRRVRTRATSSGTPRR